MNQPPVSQPPVSPTALIETAPYSIETLLARSWDVLRANPIVLVVPFVAALAIVAAFAWAMAQFGLLSFFAHLFFLDPQALQNLPTPPPRPGRVIGWTFGGYALVALVVGYLLTACTFGIAGAAWERGHATLADGLAAARAALVPALVAFVGLLGLALVATVLALPTLFISFFAYAVFSMYVMPALFVGRRGGFAAIGESFRLVRRRFVPSLLTFLIAYALQYACSFLFFPLSFVPYGLFLSIALGYASFGVLAIIFVGQYRALTAPPPSAAAA